MRVGGSMWGLMSGALGRRWGRTRKRLATRLLEDHGITVEILGAAQGRERSDWRQDIYRWHASGSRTLPNGDRLTCISIDSYDTMTACARYGMDLVGDVGYEGRRSSTSLEAHAKRTSNG